MDADDENNSLLDGSPNPDRLILLPFQFIRDISKDIIPITNRAF